MIAGYIAFDHKCRDPKDKTKLDPNRTKAFAGSTAEMNRLISTVVKDEDFEERLDNLSAKQIFNVMKEMGEKPQKEFMEIMVDNDLVPKAMYTNAPEIKNAPKAENAAVKNPIVENAAEKPQVTGKTEPTVKLSGF